MGNKFFIEDYPVHVKKDRVHSSGDDIIEAIFFVIVIVVSIIATVSSPY